MRYWRLSELTGLAMFVLMAGVLTYGATAQADPRWAVTLAILAGLSCFAAMACFAEAWQASEWRRHFAEIARAVGRDEGWGR